MQDPISLIERPFKYAFLVGIVFAISSFLLGYIYQFLAFAALGASEAGASWPEIRQIGGFGFDRLLRYFIFFFLSFIILQCVSRTSVRESPWSLLVLLAVTPSIMSFTPYLFTGSFSASSHWALVSLLIGLMYFGVGATTRLRTLFFVILLFIVTTNALSDASLWLEEFHKVALKIVGERQAESKTWSSLVAFAPACVVAIAVQIYLVYRVPLNFLRATSAEEATDK